MIDSIHKFVDYCLLTGKTLSQIIVYLVINRKTNEQRLGDVLRARREELGMSQENLALTCGLHRTYISQLERGQKSPTLRVICLIAEALKTTPVDLIQQATSLNLK